MVKVWGGADLFKMVKVCGPLETVPWDYDFFLPCLLLPCGVSKYSKSSVSKYEQKQKRDLTFRSEKPDAV